MVTASGQASSTPPTVAVTHAGARTARSAAAWTPCQARRPAIKGDTSSTNGVAVHPRHGPQMPDGDVQVPVEPRLGGRPVPVPGQPPRTGPVPREIDQRHRVPAPRQRVREPAHEPPAGAEPVRHHYSRHPSGRPGTPHDLDRHPLDHHAPPLDPAIRR